MCVCVCVCVCACAQLSHFICEELVNLLQCNGLGRLYMACRNILNICYAQKYIVLYYLQGMK